MKHTLTTLAAVSFAFLSSCGEKEKHGPNDGHDHGDHSGHDHAKGAHDDHAGHDHAKGGHDDHAGHDHAGHDHAKAGPNKGRMITDVSPQAEFLVLEDGKVQISFFDEAMNPVAPAGQTVSVLSGSRSAPSELVFEVQGNTMLSTTALPKGNDFPTVVAIKADPGAEETVTKFTLNLRDCSTCDNKEYACECHH